MRKNKTYQEYLNLVIRLCEEASKAIIDIFNRDFEVEIKDDNSPVTVADKISNSIIVNGLSKAYPDYGILSEELADDYSRLEKQYVWIIDPLDGTQEFVNHNEQFNINVALSKNGEIVLGVIYRPINNSYYYAIKGEGAFLVSKGIERPIHVNDKVDNLVCLTSLCHQNAKEQFIIDQNMSMISECIPVGAALKAGLIAEGKAEIAYRITPNTKEWDTAPMQIVLEEAGGIFIEPNGHRIKYNKKDVFNHEGYICANKASNIHYAEYIKHYKCD